MPPARRAWSKPVASSIVAGAGLAVPESIALSHEAFRELGAASVLRVVRAALEGDLVVKPAPGGSAQGVTIVDDTTDLPRAMVDAYTYADVAVVERRIVGTEIAVGVIDTGDGPRALTPVEIEPTAGVYSFEARYNAGETTFYAPSRLDDAVIAAAWRMPRCSRIARSGSATSPASTSSSTTTGTPWFLEANVMPGLTETSLVPLAIEASGTSAPTVYDGLVRSAAARACMTSLDR